MSRFSGNFQSAGCERERELERQRERERERDREREHDRERCRAPDDRLSADRLSTDRSRYSTSPEILDLDPEQMNLPISINDAHAEIIRLRRKMSAIGTSKYQLKQKLKSGRRIVALDDKRAKILEDKIKILEDRNVGLETQVDLRTSQLATCNLQITLQSKQIEKLTTEITSQKTFYAGRMQKLEKLVVSYNSLLVEYNKLRVQNGNLTSRANLFDQLQETARLFTVHTARVGAAPASAASQ